LLCEVFFAEIGKFNRNSLSLTEFLLTQTFANQGSAVEAFLGGVPSYRGRIEVRQIPSMKF
jgi:hypothetical protein